MPTLIDSALLSYCGNKIWLSNNKWSVLHPSEYVTLLYIFDSSLEFLLWIVETWWKNVSKSTSISDKLLLFLWLLLKYIGSRNIECSFVFCPWDMNDSLCDNLFQCLGLKNFELNSLKLWAKIYSSFVKLFLFYIWSEWHKSKQ